MKTLRWPYMCLWTNSYTCYCVWQYSCWVVETWEANSLALGPPSAPLSFLHTIEAYGSGNYSVIVQWEAPDDTGGVGISNYTTTLHTLHKEHIYTEQRNYLRLILSYNQVYSFQVVATNCMGTGPPVFLTGVYSSKSAFMILFSFSFSVVKCHQKQIHHKSYV